MELLIQARADVHRECGPMISGRLVPLRFAARAQRLGSCEVGWGGGGGGYGGQEQEDCFCSSWLLRCEGCP